MTADRFTQAVRQRLRLGRLLPLGGPRDGAWISEEAAEAVLLRAAKDLPGVRLGPLRIGLADPADAHEPAVPPPPSALPPGPLRVTAEFAAALSEPLPTTAHRLRALLAAAADGLGLAVAEVDLRVTDLLDEESEPAPVRRSDAARPAEAGGGDEGRAAAAVLAVPGVARLTDLLGRPVHVEDRQGENALPRRHVRVELAVRADHRALDVVLEVRAKVEQALADHPTVAVLVTAVG
ncbi:nucleopolyhedrovirus P10 family protein [Streptomyces sp. NBC_01352]|uniref:nucleopolyhedrovirus P10 family protein n=1 Tax=unclassified Streptomyces TaxID=2593676 RepID=UPI00225079F1|nr:MULTISPECIES: nucleopolyhedrovirus P10 family protein [unclassified Streptomyces]MCX4701856.1 nucleopolyhedrovirus P10 family protein [Streptomyces sp. NBC_01373]